MPIRQWDRQVEPETRDELITELSLWHLSQVTSLSSLEIKNKIFDLILRKDIKGLVGMDLDPGSFTSAIDLYNLSQVLAFFQKRKDLDIGIDREAVAYRKFIESEESCRLVNERIQMWNRKKFHFSPDVDLILYKAARKISAILGEVPQLEDLRPRFGPGASTQITKRLASARAKLSEPFCCSEDLLPMASCLLEEMPGWVFRPEDPDRALVPVVIHDAKLCFVPKNAKTDRAICVEPSLNSMWQLAIGDDITRRLKRFGVDLSDQTRNQSLAREGSITGALATLDLSSASDSLSRELVFHLLGYEWATFLDYFRSGFVQYGKVRMKLHKFSSMGNGFTFPLESLIFYALASSCCESKKELERTSVYGDDIIIPVERAPLLIKALSDVGFTTNEKKSFIAGPFRESCGKDYLMGIDVRPSFLKDGLTGADAFVLHNYYVRTWQPEPAKIVFSYISPDLVLKGPDGFGDGHLLSDDWIPTPKGRNLGWCGYIFDTYTYKSRKSFRVLPGDRVLPLYSIYMRENVPVVERNKEFHYAKDRLGVTLPGTRGYKRISIYTLKK
jgi:hypothetical protein